MIITSKSDSIQNDQILDWTKTKAFYKYSYIHEQITVFAQMTIFVVYDMRELMREKEVKTVVIVQRCLQKHSLSYLFNLGIKGQYMIIFDHGRFGQDVLATYIEKTDVLAKSIIYVLIIDIKATNIFNLLI